MDKLQAQNWGKFNFKVKFHLEGHGGLPPPKKKNNRDLNQSVLHLWSKIGDPSLNRSWIIAQISKWLISTWTHRQMQATTTRESWNWPGVKIAWKLLPVPKISFKYPNGQWAKIKLWSWWCHQMETSFVLLALCAGNSPVTGEFPAQRPETRSFTVFLICAWINN